MVVGAISPNATPSLIGCVVMGFIIGAMVFVLGIRRQKLVALPLLLGAVVNLVALLGILNGEGVAFVAACLVALDAPIVLWFVAAMWARRQIKRGERRANGLCTHCGYPLAGLHGAACPECGTINP